MKVLFDINKFLVICVLMCLNSMVYAERIKDIASIQGVRPNQLIGYGLVVGLDGTGDQTTQTPFTVQSVNSMLTQLGVTLPVGTNLQLKNVAAVMLTATLQPFAQPGQQIDVTVSSLGNAKSLRGGTLLLTPLKGADGQVYAIAQGNILVGGAGASGGGSKAQVNHLSAGRIPAGATIERAVASPFGQSEKLTLELLESDFTTAQRVVAAINASLGENTALAQDARVINVRMPQDNTQRVAWVAMIENIEIKSGANAAKVIINARTGSVVMNEMVTLQPCAIAHGNLSVTVQATPQVSQPNALSNGKTVQTQATQVEIKSDKGQLVQLPSGAKLTDVVKALNSIGVSPQDLLALLQALKAAGALKAELEII